MNIGFPALFSEKQPIKTPCIQKILTQNRFPGNTKSIFIRSNHTNPMESGNTKKKSEIVKLNVGGRKYTTTRSTLEKCGETFFTRMLANDDAGRIPCARDEEGYIFIDRNGETFAEVLDCMRNGGVSDDTDTKRRKVDDELGFFGIGTGKKAEESRPGEIFFAVCRKIREEKIVKELDRNAKAIEEDILNSISAGYTDWSICIEKDRKCWIGSEWSRAPEPPIELKIDSSNGVLCDMMFDEIKRRWGLKEKKWDCVEMAFDLSHFMECESEDPEDPEEETPPATIKIRRKVAILAR